jgi:hypothetical protein
MKKKFTQVYSPTILYCIEKDITHCNKLGNILLCRDFDARISCANDFFLSDESKFTPNYGVISFSMQSRISCFSSWVYLEEIGGL